MDFPIEIENCVYYPGGSKTGHDKRHQGLHNPKDWVWRWSIEKFKFGYKNGFVVIKSGKDRCRIYTKTYLNARISKKGKDYFVEKIERDQIMSSLALVENEFSNDNAKKELGELLSKNAFDFPKPTTLIERLLRLGGEDKMVILDFFAGSGTTGHAVMSLNAKDGGKRKFILVTNNENGICEKVTYERLKRVIAKENYAARLKYMKIDYLPIEERMYDRYAENLLKHVRELVELENGLDFEHETGVAIVLTDGEAETLAKDKKRLAACRVIYKGHNVLLSAKTAAAFEKSGVTIRPIPKYYYPELEY